MLPAFDFASAGCVPRALQQVQMFRFTGRSDTFCALVKDAIPHNRELEYGGEISGLNKSRVMVPVEHPSVRRVGVARCPVQAHVLGGSCVRRMSPGPVRCIG